MVTLKVISKVEMGEKWQMFPLVDVIDSGIEKMKWVVRWLGILVEDDGRVDPYVL